MSWTIEFGRETPKDGRWSTMTVHSEAGTHGGNGGAASSSLHRRIRAFMFSIIAGR